MSTVEYQSRRVSILPVVEFATVPDNLRRDKWSAVADKDRCDAAIRPWLNGGGQVNKWARCTRKRSHNHCLCGQHRNQAALTGYVDWNDEKTRQNVKEFHDKNELLRLIMSAISEAFVVERIVFAEGSDCIQFSINRSDFEVTLNLGVREIVDGVKIVSLASQLLRFAIVKHEMQRKEKEGNCQ